MGWLTLTDTYGGGPPVNWDGRRAIREGAALASIFTLVNAYCNPPMTYSWAGYAGATLGSWAGYFIISALFCFVVNRYMGRPPLNCPFLGNLVLKMRYKND